MDFLPVFLRLKEQKVLLVGGGHVAVRKANLLLRAGAELIVVAPDICSDLQAILVEPHSSRRRNYMDGDLDGFIEAYLQRKFTKGSEALSTVSELDDL